MVIDVFVDIFLEDRLFPSTLHESFIVEMAAFLFS